MSENSILTPAEVAERVGRSARTVRRWVREKKLRRVNLGGSGKGARYGVRVVDLDAFLAQCER